MKLEKPGSVILFASQIAACIGYNRHKRPWESMESMWERTRPDMYRQALVRNGCLTEAERLDKIVDRHEGLSSILETSLQEYQSSHDVARTYDIVSQQIKDLGSTLDISTDDQAVIDSIAKRNLYTTYGTSSEVEALKKMEDMLGVRGEPDDNFYKLHIGTVDGVDLYVGGKIDAISPDRRLVIEIKNRIRRLFYKVPFYEVIQLQTYLQLLSVERGVIIECLNVMDSTAATMNVLPIQRDRGLWASVIVPKMKAYTRVFVYLMSSVKFQDDFLRASPARRHNMIMSRMRAQYQ